MTEPDLSQAIRIVLKYEIQSLLQRLSDSGEEYIVLTVSAKEKTCGHLGSDKGESFFQASGLEGVEQDFLDFCFNESMTADQDFTSHTSSGSAAMGSDITTSAVDDVTTSSRGSDITNSRSGDAASCLTSSTVNNGQTAVSESPDTHELTTVVIKTEPENDKETENILIKFESDDKTDQMIDNKEAGQNMPYNRYTWTEEKCTVTDTISLSPESDRELPDYQQRQSIQQVDANMSKPQSRSEATKSSWEKAMPETNKRASIHKATRDDSSVLPKVIVHDVMNGINDMKSAFVELGNMAKCLLCNKVLTQRSKRMNHWRTHVGVSLNMCYICLKNFANSSHLQAHIKTHMDEKVFQCMLCECERKFRRNSDLLGHMVRFHSEHVM